MKQDQGARLGIDGLIANIPSGMHLALQVKSPWSIPRDQLPYRFAISDRQNLNLLRLAAIRPDAFCDIILPQYNTAEAFADSLNNTFGLEIQKGGSSSGVIKIA